MTEPVQNTRVNRNTPISAAQQRIEGVVMLTAKANAEGGSTVKVTVGFRL